IVRHEPLPFAHPVPGGSAAGAAPRALPMVVAAASPREQPPLQLEREVRIIREALGSLEVEGVRINPEPVLMAATPLELADALRGVGSAAIFHFVGHGIARARSDPFSRDATREEGILYFVGDKAANSQVEVRADDLARLLQQAAVRLAVLGACYSGLRSERYPWDSVAGALAARGIPAVVSMQYEVVDSMAIRFSQSFYGALAAGLSLDEAMTLGRLAMLQEADAGPDEVVNLEWGMPVLYSRLPGGSILPELAARDTETARQMRTTIQQTIDTIAESGKVIGIDAEVLDGSLSFHVRQEARTVRGTMVGIRIGRPGGGAV
ncbi:MAG TPA: CHAT domain-containing protein, partial [Anaerolineae bacterium]|nr:CHAT domain-containing protein [Anaerolineae bacterium]